MQLRVGQGVDTHTFIAGRPLILGGIEIESEKGLSGHSDADALLHAITDAVLGATGRGDIGSYFPDTDEKWKGADSKELFRIVWNEISAQGWGLINLDATVVTEAPKLNPFIASMKESVAELFSTSPDRIGLKATTAEKMGALGRGEGLLALAVVLLSKDERQS